MIDGKKQTRISSNVTISSETKRKVESSSRASVLGNGDNHFQVRQRWVIIEGWRQVKSVIEIKLTSVIA
jgi:hypothetical protein